MGWLVASLLILPDVFDFVTHHLAFRGPDKTAKFAWNRIGFTDHSINVAAGRKTPAQKANQTM
jgi:hypothetical protein